MNNSTHTHIQAAVASHRQRGGPGGRVGRANDQFESDATVASDALDLSDSEVAHTIAAFNERGSTMNWFLLTYAKNSNRLKLVGSGENGLEDMVDELDNGKAMYGLFRFKLNEERTKVVYLTWVPDGVPTVIKGAVNLHAGQIAKSMKAFHVQVNARTEDDLDEAVLRKKIEQSAGARY